MEPWSSSWQMGLNIGIVLSINSIHFKRKVKKLNVKTSSASIRRFFSFITLIQKIVFWLAAWLATHVTLNSTTNLESALLQTITFGEIVCTILTNKYINKQSFIYNDIPKCQLSTSVSSKLFLSFTSYLVAYKNYPPLYRRNDIINSPTKPTY